jgi:predicted DNA binding protein
MVLSTKVYVEDPDLALVQTIRSLPGVDVGVVSDAGTDPQHDVHCFWVETDDFEAFEAALDADSTVASYSALAGTEERRTYQIEYSDDATLVTPVVTEAGGLVVDSHSHADGWVLQLQLHDRETLYELDGFAEDEDMRFEVLELREAADGEVDAGPGLTEPQVETLVSAYLHGYYDEPREATLETLADLLDVSQTAVSGRLRRGSAALIEDTLVDGDGGGE